MYDSVSFFSRLGKLTGQNKLRYATRHGYDMVFSTPHHTSGIYKQIHCNADPSLIVSGPDTAQKCWTHDTTFDIDHTRAPTFGKIKLSLAACRGRENAWLLWSDADAMIINQTVPLQYLIDDGYDIMLAYDWLMLNAGMLLLKCSDWTIALLSRMNESRKFDKAFALDQSSLQQHLDNLTAIERNAHVKIVPKYAMNVYTEEYVPGDFLMHFAGKLYEATEEGLVAIANQFDILSMMDDIEDIRPFFRGQHFLNYYSGTCKVSRGVKQKSCKPSDPRRIILNESLGAMSVPNRYRHVSMRYYWMDSWKDKYDVPGWDKKRRQLPMPLPRSQTDMPAPPPASLHLGDALRESGTESHLIAEHKEVQLKDDTPEVDHNFAVKIGEASLLAKDHGKSKGGTESQVQKDDDDDDDNDDENNNDGWPICVWVVIVLFSVAVISGIVFFLKKRRKMTSKIQ